MRRILEICADSFESAKAAELGGADRLELCGSLLIGGVSPSIELFNLIKRNIDIKINVLIRPRFGDFLYTPYEFEIIKNEVRLFKEKGADGIVIGMLMPDGNLDVKRLKELKDIAGHMHITLHRAFDLCSDPFRALKEAKDLGFSSILTSGQKNKAIDGMALINQLQEEEKDIEIMAGSGMGEASVKTFLENTCINAFHMSGKKTLDSAMVYRKDGVNMGLPLMSEYELWQTDTAEVQKVRALIDGFNPKGR
ncbi:copper homeostasis protein CutC [Anaeropeptidivorans aminofermentans]|uniref:copper homeostasis protein CutC n=1 Tax=Anaeropeptidivorans aminofermentans TaxID=2934315 RepID=UPI0020248585|nr:copper homeostasis protein CutC [Anaeropeptidivorans aminofermentans]MBE6012774.1 copper homeostasis protein CutC [Lachnospiraceae bacterium]